MKSLLIILFLFTSCNVLKAIQGQGEAPDDRFFETGDSPEQNYFFFSCNGGHPCMLNTLDNSYVQIDVDSDSLSSPNEFFHYQGFVFYQAFNGSYVSLYRYEISSGINDEVDINGGSDSNPFSFQEYNGELYFIALTSGGGNETICKMSGPLNTPDCRGTFAIGDITYLKSVYSESNSQLIACYINGATTLHDVDTADSNFSLTNIVPTAGGSEVDCGSSYPIPDDGRNGFVYITSNSNQILRYSINDGVLESHVGAAESFDAIKVSYTGKFYFQDVASSKLHVLEPGAALGSFSEITGEGNYDPSNLNIVESPFEIMFTDYDGSGNENVYFANISNYSEVNLMIPGGSDPILFMEGMESGLYVFTISGITRYGSDNSTENLGGSVDSPFSFLLVRDHEIYK